MWPDAAAYDATVRRLIGRGAALDERSVYFLARLSPRYPTVEIRVADVCLDVDTAVLLAGLARALVATVFLGSGLLFVAMLFVATAVAGGLFVAASRSSGPPGGDVVALGRDVTGLLVNIYSMRMAAVFMLTTVTIARRTEIVSRWLTVAGVVAALVLLVGVGFSAWVELLFPAWILALSLDILVAGPKVSPGSTGTAPEG